MVHEDQLDISEISVLAGPGKAFVTFAPISSRLGLYRALLEWEPPGSDFVAGTTGALFTMGIKEGA